MKKISILSILLLTVTSSFAQNSTQNNLDANASIERYCQLATNDINFGVVNLPLTAQSANAQMNILCSNALAYTVDLEYGGNNITKNTGTLGIEGISTSMSWKRTDYYEANFTPKQAAYRLYKNGSPIGLGIPSDNISNESFDRNLNGDNNNGDFYCSSLFPNQIYMATVESSQLLYKVNTTGYKSDTYGLCDSSNGRLNQTNFNKLFGVVMNSDKGFMTGTFRGDKLAYRITLPSDSTKSWIAKINNYQSIGIGSNQTIEINAQLIPEASSSSYIAADTYLDTITAIVIY